MKFDDVQECKKQDQVSEARKKFKNKNLNF